MGKMLVGRKHLHVQWWKNKEKSWHHRVAQGKLTYSSWKNLVIYSSRNIHYGNTSDKPLYLDLHRLIQSVDKSINRNTRLLKHISKKSMLMNRLKLGWQEEKVSFVTITLIIEVAANYRMALKISRR